MPFLSLSTAQAHDMFNRAIATIIAIVVAWLLVRLALAFIDRFFARRFVARYIPRVATYAKLAKSTIRGLAIIALVLVCLSIWSVNVAPAIWSAGVITAVLAFGAQAIVRDMLTGFSFLIEDQFDVGDRVQITTSVNSTVAGTVEAIGLRTTVITDEQGRAVTIPNGNVLYVVNSSRLPQRARISIELPLRADVGRMREKIADIVERSASSAGVPSQSVSVSVQDVHAEHATFCVEFNADRAGADVAEAALRERVAAALQAEGWLPGADGANAMPARDMDEARDLTEAAPNK